MAKWALIELNDDAILVADNDIVVVDKAAGDLCDASRDPNRDHLGTALTRWAEAQDQPTTFHAAHRLDRATSGVVVFARHKAATTALMKQFEARATTKRYQAVVTRPDNTWVPGAAFERRSYLRHRRGVSEEVRSGGKPAHSRFTVADASGALSLVDASPLTGRTHQLRVHLAALNAPIVGDDRYGRGESGRLWLHARSLTFDHPGTGQTITIESRIRFAIDNGAPTQAAAVD